MGGLGRGRGKIEGGWERTYLLLQVQSVPALQEEPRWWGDCGFEKIKEKEAV